MSVTPRALLGPSTKRLTPSLTLTLLLATPHSHLSYLLSPALTLLFSVKLHLPQISASERGPSLKGNEVQLPPYPAGSLGFPGSGRREPGKGVLRQGGGGIRI